MASLLANGISTFTLQPTSTTELKPKPRPTHLPITQTLRPHQPRTRFRIRADVGDQSKPTPDDNNNSQNTLGKLLSQKYKYGFNEKIESFTIPKGLSEETVRKISEIKEEPEWMLEFRLNSYRKFMCMFEPKWSDNEYPVLNLQDVCFYSAPKKKPTLNSLEEASPELLDYFERLGIPLTERNRLANVNSNVAVDAVLDSVSIATTHRKTLEKSGVIFCSISEAIKEYPELVRKYLGRVVACDDNYYAALNSAVFSDGSFVYIPKGTKCPMQISTYFRINAYETGQFERTLIVAEEGSFVEYLEGCTAPSYDTNQLHAAVVELYADTDAEIKYSTVQNWYAGDENGKGGIYNFVTKRGLCAGARSKISWTQVETGSAITWKYPSVVLEGDGSVGEFYSVALTNNYQQADTGTKMIHKGKNTRSRIISKGISAGHSRNVYRGLVQVMSRADNARNSSQCDSMLIGDQAAANTYPYIQVKNPSARIEHEASTSKIGEDQLFYFQQRGIDFERAMAAMISGFCKDVFNELPDEFGAEVNQLMSIKLEVKVPPEAYMMDFVFSEREDGGIFDNKNNMDYHIPVFGGIAKESPMHIVHIAVEMAPIAKVGGLADVVTSLCRAVQDLNHHVDILLPKYDCINTNNVKDLHYQRSFHWGGVEIKVWFGKVEGLSVYFLEPRNGLFWTGCVYAGRNDGHRFGFFCHAALEFLFQSGFHPDIIHCHDWSSAPVAWLYKDHYRQCGLSKARVVFTIHNLEFGANLIGKAMAFADKATTVSGTYSKEVAGNPAIAPHLYKFHGILNGIDPDIWDPYNDNLIPVSYTSENVAEGKQAAKEMLQQRLSIRKADVPVVGIISRLTHQKGIHLIKHAIWRTIERGGQVVLLGSAPDPRIQQEFVDLSNQMHNLHSDRGRLVLNYDEPLSHLIYAGADFILVPSIFEPCGLTQLVAMRYGAIPVVRKTGGLYDTVFDVDHDQERARAHGLEPNGFSFEGADQGGVDYALNRAISAWYDGKEWLNSLRKRVMEQDWSWNRPALEYIELYHAARKN